MDDLVSKFDAQAHPRCQSREKSVEQVRAEFGKGIQRHCAPDGHVTEDAFINYYLDMNSVLPKERESYFQLAVTSPWGIHKENEEVKQQRIIAMVNTMFEKIRQRTHGNDDEGKTVKRFLKHYDVKQCGGVNQKEFKEALNALGCYFSDSEVAALFAHLDDNKNGVVDYEELAGRMALRGTGNNPNVNPVFGLNREPPTATLEKIRSFLKQRGLFGVRELVQLFAKFDRNSDAKLDRHEIQMVLKKNGQNLTPSEFERVFRYFDANGDGTISTSEFIRGIRGELNETRLNCVKSIWQKVAPFGDIPVADLLEKFNYASNEDCASGAISRGELMEELARQIDQNSDNKISEDEFVDFYTNIGANFDADETFCKFARTQWGLY